MENENGEEKMAKLTHEVLVVVVVFVINDSHLVALVKAAESARPEAIAVNRRSALEAGLTQTLVQALAE